MVCPTGESLRRAENMFPGRRRLGAGPTTVVKECQSCPPEDEVGLIRQLWREAGI